MRPAAFHVLLAAAAAASAALATAPARAAPPVDLALVLLSDVSGSIDDGEYAMEKEGYRAAFADPDVVAAITGGGSIAVTYVEFSGRDEVTRVAGWSVLDGAGSARAFGEQVAAAPRTSAGETSISVAIDQAVRMLRDGGFGSARLVIDVAGDDPDQLGRSVAASRDAAVAEGITINGLPIIDEQPYGTTDGRLSYGRLQPVGGLANYFRRNVAGGEGSFVVEARDFRAFGEALKKKLLLEITAGREGARRRPLTVAARAP